MAWSASRVFATRGTKESITVPMCRCVVCGCVPCVSLVCRCVLGVQVYPWCAGVSLCVGKSLVCTCVPSEYSACQRGESDLNWSDVSECASVAATSPANGSGF